MPEVTGVGVRIRYDAVGEGRPLILLHGFAVDRTWWTKAGYVADLSRDHRLLILDLPGHGASEPSHEPASYSWDALVGDVLAVAGAEGVERFAIWGQSYGGWIAWRTATAAPERTAAIVTTGAWDPREEEVAEIDPWSDALRRGGTQELIAQFDRDFGERFIREFPDWARTITLRSDPEALLAVRRARQSTTSVTSWLSEEELRGFGVPVLLITGEQDDEDDDAAEIAAMVPDGQRLRLPGVGHAGSCAAGALTVPPVRRFLEERFG